MSADVRSLDEIRTEIDKIDSGMRELLIRRMSLMAEVAAAKQKTGTDTVRPSREAALMRSLVQQNQGPPSPAMLLRIWREIINSGTALQGPLAVAVCAPEKSVGYWDLARNHFGTDTPMTLHTTPLDVLRRVTDEPGTIGVLPLPQEGEDEPWWPGLASSSNAQPRIIWRLPFYTPARGRFENLSAFAVAKIDPEPSGSDVTVILVETTLDVSRGRIVSALETLGLAATMMATHQDERANRRIYLLEIDGFVQGSDPRWESYAEALGKALQRVAVLGAYPAPMVPMTMERKR